MYKATLKTSAEESVEVAVKSVKHESTKARKDFVREMCVMSRMLHPNIVRLYGLVLKGTSNLNRCGSATNNYFSLFFAANLIVLEYMHYGDLANFLQV